MLEKEMTASAQDGGQVNQAGRDLIVVPPAKKKSAWFEVDWDFLEKKTARTVSPKYIREYVEGSPPSWSLIFQRKTVFRPQTKQILQEMQEHPVIAVLGAGAEGKSTILKQVAAELVRAGSRKEPAWDVYFVDHADKPLSLDGIPFHGSRPRVFLVDNAPLNQTFASFLQEIRQEETDYLLFAGRSNEWETYVNAHGINTRGIPVVELSLNAGEEASFADYLLNEQITRAMSREALISLFQKERNNGYLYSSMLMALHNGVELEQVVPQIMGNIERKAAGNFKIPVESVFRVLALVCIVEECGHKCSYYDYKHYCEFLHIPMKELGRLLKREVQRIGSCVETRHPTISRLFAAYLYGEEGWLNKEKVILDCFEHFLRYLSPKKDQMHDLHRWGRNPVRQKLKALISLAIELPESEDLREHLFQRLLEELPDYALLNMLLRAEDDLQQREKLYIRLHKRGVGNGFFTFPLARLLQKNGKIGTPDDEYTARWVLRTAFENNPANSNTAAFWANLEIQLGNVGTIGEEYSARWILRTAFERNPVDNNAATFWANLEAEQGNIGTIDEQYSARWILHTAFECNPADNIVVTVWANLEIQQGNIGTVGENYSARWILRTAFERNPVDHNAATIWANLEAGQGNIGTIGEEYSARWILRTAFERNPVDSDIAVVWAKLEIQQGNIGTINEEYSARGILHTAFERNPGETHIATVWANLEIQQGNIGTINEEYSARGILHTAFERNPVDSDIAVVWAKLEIQQGNIGTVDEKYSARWILRTAFERNPVASNIAVVWANLETQQGNTGTYPVSEPYTAHWVFQQIPTTTNAAFTKRKANFYYLEGQTEAAVDMLIDSLSDNYGCIGLLCEMQARQGAFSPELPYGVPKLAAKMLDVSDDRERALYWLYLCYGVWGEESEAKRYHTMLSAAGAALPELCQDVMNRYEDHPYYAPLIQWMKEHPEDAGAGGLAHADHTDPPTG